MKAGTPFGRYRLIEMLGRGGMGEVWRAQDTAANNRIVAIKLLLPHFAADPTFVQRFRREADGAAMLNNPHIIPIHNYGEIDGRLYVDMRLIDGRDLEGVLHDDGPLEAERAVHIIDQAAKALHAAHKIGLIHRDVKPSNILVDEDDFAYLIDFGISRARDSTRLTNTGNAIGTFHYMAPERLGAAGEEDARADIYALACVLYECLTGMRPFPGENHASLVAAHLNTPPPRPSITDPKISGQFDVVIGKGMAKDPDQRYATTIELARAAKTAVTEPKPVNHAKAGREVVEPLRVNKTSPLKRAVQSPSAGNVRKQTSNKSNAQARKATPQQVNKRDKLASGSPAPRRDAERKADNASEAPVTRQPGRQSERTAAAANKSRRMANLLLGAMVGFVLIAAMTGIVFALRADDDRTLDSHSPSTPASVSGGLSGLANGTYAFSASDGAKATWTVTGGTCSPECRVNVASSNGWSTEFRQTISDWWRSETVLEVSEAPSSCGEDKHYIYLRASTLEGKFYVDNETTCDETFKLSKVS